MENQTINKACAGAKEDHYLSLQEMRSQKSHCKKNKMYNIKDFHSTRRTIEGIRPVKTHH